MQGRFRLIAAAVTGTLTLIGLMVAYANSATAARVAANAAELHWSNAVLGTAALARAAAGQLGLANALVDTGGVDVAAAELARRELVATRTALAGLVAAGPDPRSFDDLLAALDSDEPDVDAVDFAYRLVADRLSRQIGELEDSIQMHQTRANRTSAAVRFTATLLLPATAILLYRRRAQNQLREAEVRLASQLEAQREVARAKDQFIAGMSHELRTPLTAIYGFSELLVDTPLQTDLDRELVAVVHDEAANLSRMVDDFIVASRLDGPGVEVELREVDPDEVARLVIGRFRKRGIEVGLEGSALSCRADPGRLLHILNNLVANAVRHGGSQIWIGLDTADDAVEIAVVDDGDGVPEDMEARLFQRFVHEDAEPLTAGSLGLGTWVAASLARAMGGAVTYRRRSGLTEFVVTLPLARVAVGVAEDG